MGSSGWHRQSHAGPAPALLRVAQVPDAGRPGEVERLQAVLLVRAGGGVSSPDPLAGQAAATARGYHPHTVVGGPAYVARHTAVCRRHAQRLELDVPQRAQREHWI